MCKWFKVVIEVVRFLLAWSSCFMSRVISLTCTEWCTKLATCWKSHCKDSSKQNVNVHSTSVLKWWAITKKLHRNYQPKSQQREYDMYIHRHRTWHTMASDFSALSLISLIFVNSWRMAFCASSNDCRPSSPTFVCPRITTRTSSSSRLKIQSIAQYCVTQYSTAKQWQS